ncbi:MAG TPA: hypothetical protein VF887_05315 [Gemmatimonadaceae bacterium]
MHGFLMLWLPILLSAVVVFVVSSVIHMASPWHKNDYPKLANEDQFRNAVRPLAIPPGDYMIPRPASREDLRSPEFAEKVNQGPRIVMTVMRSGPFSMKSSLIQWFLYTLVVSAFAAFVAGSTLPAGAPQRSVFHLVSITAFIAYSVALWQMSIWYSRSWGTTFKATVDGLIYALLTAAVFVWLWPQ